MHYQLTHASSVAIVKMVIPNSIDEYSEMGPKKLKFWVMYWTCIAMCRLRTTFIFRFECSPMKWWCSRKQCSRIFLRAYRRRTICSYSRQSRLDSKGYTSTSDITAPVYAWRTAQCAHMNLIFFPSPTRSLVSTQNDKIHRSISVCSMYVSQYCSYRFSWLGCFLFSTQ